VTHSSAEAAYAACGANISEPSYVPLYSKQFVYVLFFCSVAAFWRNKIYNDNDDNNNKATF